MLDPRFPTKLASKYTVTSCPDCPADQNPIPLVITATHTYLCLHWGNNIGI